MPPDDRNSISRAIGELEGSLKSFREHWQEQDRRAAESRRLLYQEFGQMKDKLNLMSAELENLSVDVREMQPAVRDWVIVKAKGMGAALATSWIGRTIWIVVGGLIGFFGWLLGHGK